MDHQLSFDNNGLFWFFGNKEYNLEDILSQKCFYLENRVIPTSKLLLCEQVHQDGIIITDQIISNCADLAQPIHIPNTDSLITSKKNWFLCILTADCITVLIYDKIKKIVAAVHSGRKGTQLNIVGKTLDLLFTHFNSRPQDISLILGPGISALHYKVSAEIFEKFVQNTAIEQKYPYLDLRKVIQIQIEQKGITDVIDNDICTYEHPYFYSYRKNKTSQRQLSLIGLY